VAAPSKFKNWDELNKSALRQAALELAEAALGAIDTREVMKKAVRLEGETLYFPDQAFSLKETGKVLTVGIGKCALEAAQVVEEVLGERLDGGMVLVPQAEGQLKRLRVFQGDHPMPTERNVEATRKILSLLSGLTANDLVIFIISGGGSTLLSQPTNFTCREEALILGRLIKSGAAIQEINTLRKHTSRARGGNLAAAAYPARVVSLIFSDVPGDELSVIASGPTVKDETSVADAQKIVDRYELAQTGDLQQIALLETPKDDKYFSRVTNLLLVSNRLALEAMAEKARTFGFTPRVCTACLTGEAREVGERLVQELDQSGPQTALLYGGETTVTVKGSGRGGRNQELVLSALRRIKSGELILSLASDGRDNSDFAGALCDIMTRERAEKLHLDWNKYLAANDSYNFFAMTGDYLLTGPTGSNVSDLIIALRET